MGKLMRVHQNTEKVRARGWDEGLRVGAAKISEDDTCVKPSQ
jgi:hypothetical protein